MEIGVPENGLLCSLVVQDIFAHWPKIIWRSNLNYETTTARLGLVIIFTSSFTALMESLACWGTGNYLIECCFVCCETPDDCSNYSNNPDGGDYNCRLNLCCLINPAYCSGLDTCLPDSEPCPVKGAINNDGQKIETLRRFRDEVLAKTPVGREYIRLYYQWSPAIVHAMEEDEEFKEAVKVLIEELLPSIEKMLQ